MAKSYKAKVNKPRVKTGNANRREFARAKARGNFDAVDTVQRRRGRVNWE